MARLVSGVCVAVALATVVGGAASVRGELPRVLTLDSSPIASTAPAGDPLAGRAMEKARDYGLRLTLYWDNDGNFAHPIDEHDKHYTAGVGASLTFQAPFIDKLGALVPSIGNEFAPEHTTYAAGIVGSLNMFTPGDYSISKPQYNDRPYAGWTYAGIFAQRANRDAVTPVWEALEVDLGLLGPSSLAENAQDLIHGAFNYAKPQGWKNQIGDEVDFDIKYNRRWKLHVLDSVHDAYHWAPKFEVLPEVGATVGSFMDEVHAGGVFRMGWNMLDDFGPGRMAMPADFTWQANCGCNGISWADFLANSGFYLYARPYGEGVARNDTLQGDTWNDRDKVTSNPTPGIFGVEYGLNWHFAKFLDFNYSWTTQSKEFEGQHNWDTYGSLQLSFSIAW